MADGQTITTVAAVLVAGFAGPGITAWATAAAQKRRFEHELDLHDRVELRDRLEALAEGLAAVRYATRKALVDTALPLHDDDRDRKEAAAAAQRARDAATRLQLWLAADEPASVHGQLAASSWSAAVSHLQEQQTAEEWNFSAVLQTYGPLERAAATEAEAFVAAAQNLLAQPRTRRLGIRSKWVRARARRYRRSRL